MEFEITPEAMRLMRMALWRDGGPTGGLRVALTPSGCLRLAAAVSVRPQPDPGDSVVDHDGLRFFLPADSLLLLEGVTIDVVGSAGQTGLVFYDPRLGDAGRLH